MNIVCLDLEGILIPEIWIEFAKASGIPELTETTRDEPDYEVLMRRRLDTLNKHGKKFKDILTVIEQIEPMPGAREFLDALRDRTQVLILSDTFEEFARPVMKKLGQPTIFCHSLAVSESGDISGIRLRVKDSKRSAVLALQGIGFDTIAVGDSYNDLGMLKASRNGFLFRTTDKIRAEHPELPAFTEYGELLDAITASLD